MNAESTVFRASRPAVVVAPGGEGARAAAWLLAWPMRLAATPMGRRLLAAVVLAVVAVATVSYLYGSPHRPREAVAFRPAGPAASPLCLAAVVRAGVAVATVSSLYGSPDRPREAVAFRPAGLAASTPTGDAT